MPFFIDWGDGAHPADDLQSAGTLEAITVESPHAAALRRLLGNVDVPLVVRTAAEPALHATIVTAHGDVVLETAEAYFGEWLHTGDLGYQNEHGYLFLVDRAKDMIITGGMNVYSTEVESAIQALAGVAQVMVVGVPDEDWGKWSPRA